MVDHETGCSDVECDQDSQEEAILSLMKTCESCFQVCWKSCSCESCLNDARGCGGALA